MRCRQLLSLFCLWFCISPASAGDRKVEKASLLYAGKQRAYYLFVPDTIKPEQPAPLLVLLHGSGHNGSSLVEKWKPLAAKEGIILVGPDSANSAGWSVPNDGPDFLRDVVEAVKAKSAINPRRVYLFGHSAGAVFSIYMSLLESEYFAATALHAGAIDVQKDAIYFPFAKRKIAFLILAGTKDPLFPLATVRATRDALSANGFAAQLIEIPNHTHDYYSSANEINRQAWEFLKKNELAQEPQYTQYKLNN